MNSGVRLTFWSRIVRMFLGSDGVLSSTKIMSFVSFLLLICLTTWLVYSSPDKMAEHYVTMAYVLGACSGGLRVADKYINNKGIYKDNEN